ncbi:MAG: class I SAM-dependent methyltransferase [Pseudoxanthomonas sp.]
MGSENQTVRRKVWGAYWASGRLHSCTNTPDRNYEGAIGDFWDGFFAATRKGARILDLATGNGALPLRVHRSLEGRARVDAIDLAALSPAWYEPAKHTEIRFHAGIGMEKLPFEDAMFDEVVSQFGFEYADRPRALSEALRAAAPGARLAFVMHHAESVLVDVGREELGHHAWLISEEGLLPAAQAIAPWLAAIRAGSAPSSAAFAARERYNRAMDELARRASVSNAPDLLLEARQHVHQIIATMAQDASSAIAAIGRFIQDLEGSRLRTSEMVNHALTVSELGSLTEACERIRPGMRIATAELRQAEGVVAWSWVACAASDADQTG